MLNPVLPTEEAETATANTDELRARRAFGESLRTHFGRHAARYFLSRFNQCYGLPDFLFLDSPTGRLGDEWFERFRAEARRRGWEWGSVPLDRARHWTVRRW